MSAPRHPLERAVDEAIRKLAALQRRNGPGPPPLTQLVNQLPRIAARAVSPGPANDGFPPSTLGGGGGGSGLTSPEAAVESMLGRKGRSPHDPVAQHGHRCATRFMNAVIELYGAVDAAAAFNALAEDAPLDVPSCESCARALPQPPAPEHWGDVGGRLHRPMHLCGDCYQFVFRRGELPTEEQVRWHAHHGRWQVRA